MCIIAKKQNILFTVRKLFWCDNHHFTLPVKNSSLSV